MNPIDATRKYRDEILSMPGVTGVFTGEKTKDGKPTGETSIVIMVREKRDVPKDQRIPKKLSGVKTDVIEEEIFPDVDSTRYDPIQPGSSLGVAGFGGGGTLGLLVTDLTTGEIALLSNYHVLFKDGTGFPGEAVVQPGAEDAGATPGDIVGRVLRGFISDTVDGAICSAFARQLNPSVLDVGAVSSHGATVVGHTVSKRGRTSGLTSGVVSAINASVTIGYPAPIGPRILHDQIRFNNTTPVMQPGDSGSALVEAGGKVVGLCLGSGSGGTVGIACRIDEVFSQLELDLYAPPPGFMTNGDDAVGSVSSIDLLLASGHPYLANWEIFGSLTLLSLDSDITIGAAVDDALTDPFTVRFFGFSVDDTKSLEVTTPTGSSNGGSESFAIQVPIFFRLNWVNPTLTVTARQDGRDDLVVTNTVTGTPTLTTPYHPVITSLRTGSGYGAQVDELVLSHDCGEVILPPGLDWVEDFADSGSWSLLTDAHFISAGVGGVSPTPEGGAHIDDIVTGGLVDFQVEGYIELGTELNEVTIALLSESNDYDIEFTFTGGSHQPSSPHRELNLIGFGSDDGAYTDQGVGFMVAGDHIDFTITVEFSTNTLSLDLAQGGETWSIVHNDTDWIVATSDTSILVFTQVHGHSNTDSGGESISSVQTVTLL